MDEKLCFSEISNIRSQTNYLVIFKIRHFYCYYLLEILFSLQAIIRSVQKELYLRLALLQAVQVSHIHIKGLE